MRAAVGVGTDPLAKALEAYLQSHASGASLPQLAHVRDLAWFPEHATIMTLARHVTRVASDHLELRGRRVGLRQDHAVPFADLMERWRSGLSPFRLICSWRHSRPIGVSTRQQSMSNW